MTNFVSYANATELMTAIGLKLAALNGAYVIKGNSAFADLPATPTAAQNGFVYNVTDEFTTDSRFVEGTGKVYPAGTNVVIVNLGDSTTPNVKYDVIGSFVDVAALEAAIDAVQAMITDNTFDTTTAYSTGEVVVHEGKLYIFTTDHAAGAWVASEVSETTVLDLISAAEPDELTSTQVNTLIGLLG